MDLILANKLLDAINKNQKDEEFIVEALKLMEEHKVEMDIISYNILMDLYCSLDQFNKAKDIFNSLPDKGIEADSFTYSILIKGLKHSKEDIIENGMNLFRRYMRTFNN